MEKDIKYSPYSNCCGRSMHYATEDKCNWTYGPISECQGCIIGRIKKDADGCKSCAIIPSITVDTTDGITNLANCFVHVTNTNTTFYIDDKHRPMIIWAGPVEVEDYNIETNELGLKSQLCFTTVDDVFTTVYYDKRGGAHIIGTEV